MAGNDSFLREDGLLFPEIGGGRAGLRRIALDPGTPNRGAREETALKAWIQTTLRLLLRPGDFFRTMSQEEGYGPALAVLAVWSALAGVLSMLYAYENVWVSVMTHFMNAFLTPFVLSLLLYPVCVVLCRNVFGYQVLLKITAYAQVTVLFSWIPGLGWMVGLWKFYLIGLGLVRVGQISALRAISVMLAAATLFLLAFKAVQPLL